MSLVSTASMSFTSFPQYIIVHYNYIFYQNIFNLISSNFMGVCPSHSYYLLRKGELLCGPDLMPTLACWSRTNSTVDESAQSDRDNENKDPFSQHKNQMYGGPYHPGCLFDQFA